MKKGTIITGAILLLATGVAVQGQEAGGNSELRYQRDPGMLYRDNEFSLDFFGGGTLDEHDIDRLTGERIHNNGRLGLGGGANYFFVRYVGIGGEVYTENPKHSFIDESSGSLILRLPIGATGLAPYIFGGGGHQFDPQPATFGHGGAGIEFRFSPNVGIFADARWVSTDKLETTGWRERASAFPFERQVNT